MVQWAGDVEIRKLFTDNDENTNDSPPNDNRNISGLELSAYKCFAMREQLNKIKIWNRYNNQDISKQGVPRNQS